MTYGPVLSVTLLSEADQVLETYMNEELPTEVFDLFTQGLKKEERMDQRTNSIYWVPRRNTASSEEKSRI